MARSRVSTRSHHLYPEGGPAVTPTTSAQTPWFVDSVNGSDSNLGTQASPLKTVGEYLRRTGIGEARQLSSAVDVFIVNSLPPSDQLIVTAYIQTINGYLRIHGVPTTVHTGTVTAYTTFAPGTNTPNDLQDGAFDFTPFVGDQVLITSGASAGARGNIVKAFGPGHARIDWLTIPQGTLDPFQEVPVGGDHYSIQTIPQVSSASEDLGGMFFADGTVHVLVELIDFTPAIAPVIGTSPNITYQYCNFGFVETDLYASLVGCQVTAGGGLVTNAGTATLSCCSLVNGSFLAVGECSHVFCHGVLFQNATAVLGASSVLQAHNLGLGIAIYDTDSWLTFELGEAGTLCMEGPLSGTNNTTFLVNLTSGSSITASSSYTELFPARVNAGTELQLNGQTTAFACARTFPFGLVAGARNLTFANLVATVAAGGFQGVAFDPLSPATGVFTTEHP